MQKKVQQKAKPEQNKQVATGPKPNEQYGFYFSSSLKITDPDTGKVIVQMRCD